MIQKTKGNNKVWEGVTAKNLDCLPELDSWGEVTICPEYKNIVGSEERGGKMCNGSGYVQNTHLLTCSSRVSLVFLLRSR